MANSGFSFDGFVRTLDNKFDSGTKEHLKNVYSCLSMTTIAAAVGGYVHLLTNLAGLLSFFIGIGLMVALLTTPDDGKNQTRRLGYLLGFAFISGLNVGPLLNIAIYVDPSIIPSALIFTSAIFICFTLCALYASDRKFLYLGGMLSSAISILLLMSLINLFLRSSNLFQLELYLGFMVVCGFVLYDTQMIIEKRRLGDKDFIAHSLHLFIDLIDIFRHLLVILIQKEQRNKRKSK